VHLVWAARVGCSKWGNRCGLLGRRTKMAILDSKMAVICQLDPISNMIQYDPISVRFSFSLPANSSSHRHWMRRHDIWRYLMILDTWPQLTDGRQSGDAF
jgi:hypothetical protein